MIIAILIITGAGNIFSQSVNTDENKLANKGYDVGNYFTANTAVKGSVEYSMKNNGATYYFVNAENLKTIKANPSKYLPQYGGNCAFAVAKMSKKSPVDPQTFRIDDGKPFNTIVPWLNNE